VAEADAVAAGVGIGAGVCAVVSPGPGVAVADADAHGGADGDGDGQAEGVGVGPSALAGEARSQAASPIAKVVITSPRRDNVVRLPKQPHLPVAGTGDGRPGSRAQLIEKLAKFSRTS